MYNGVSALKATQKGMDTIGNNIANVDTTGFKASSITFADQLSDTIKASTSATAARGGTNGQQIGLGVKVGSIDVNTTQGSLNSTGESTDLAIQGNGYFMLSDGHGNISYTRDGHFAIDSEGSLVSAATGKKVLGWNADPDGQIDTTANVSDSSSLSIPVGSLTSAKATTNVKFTGNLDAGAPPGAKINTIITVFDSLGQRHQINLALTRNADPSNPFIGGNTWSWTASGDPMLAPPAAAGTATTGAPGAAGTGAATAAGSGAPGSATSAAGAPAAAGAAKGAGAKASGAAPAAAGGKTGTASTSATTTSAGAAAGKAGATAAAPTGKTGAASTAAVTTAPAAAPSDGVNMGTITFGDDGKTLSTTGAIVLQGSSSVKAQKIHVDLGGTQSLAGDTTFQSLSQDGYASGTLQTFAIEKDGNINGIFSNGLTRYLGKISLATFNNAKGLDRIGDNEFKTSANSGAAVISGPGSSGAGSVEAGYLEQSNVDLSTELTNMIIQQRAYQANTKIVSAVDDLLDSLINMKR